MVFNLNLNFLDWNHLEVEGATADNGGLLFCNCLLPVGKGLILSEIKHFAKLFYLDIHPETMCFSDFIIGSHEDCSIQRLPKFFSCQQSLDSQ